MEELSQRITALELIVAELIKFTRYTPSNASIVVENHNPVATPIENGEQTNFKGPSFSAYLGQNDIEIEDDIIIKTEVVDDECFNDVINPHIDPLGGITEYPDCSTTTAHTSNKWGNYLQEDCKEDGTRSRKRKYSASDYSLGNLELSEPFSQPQSTNSSTGMRNEDTNICTTCGILFSENLARHDRNEASHEDGIYLKCVWNGCSSRFPKRRWHILKAHVKATHLLRPYYCSKCPLTYARKDQLELHEEFRHGIRMEKSN